MPTVRFLNELRYAAHVIRVVMRDQHVVDLLDFGALHRGHDSVGVAEGVISPTSVDEQGLAMRRNKEGGLAALDIDKENPERAFRSTHGAAEKECAERHQKSTHARDRTRREHEIAVWRNLY